MIKDISNLKVFTILLTILYISALCGVYFNFEILIAFSVLLFLIILIFFFNLGSKKALVLYLIFFAGIVRARFSLNFYSVLDNVSSKNATLEGQIISSKNISDKNNKIKFYLRADKAIVYDKNYENVNAKILVNIDNINIKDKIATGDYISLKGKLQPAYASSNPYQFDYKNYLLVNDCKNILYANSESFKKVKNLNSKNLSNSKDWWYLILKKFEKTRDKIIEKHSKNIKSPQLEILGGIVFGNETINPDETTKENFKNSGLLHLLAASGLNVALIFGIWWKIACLIRFPYNLSILSGAVFVVLYTFMTGFPPSILRAAIMLLFILLGKIIDRNADSVAIIFFTAFLILLFNPKMLFDIGFQLSFAVTFGLIFCCDIIISKFNKINQKFIEKRKNLSCIKKYFFFLLSPSSLVSIVTVPLIAQLWVIPLQMHYFNNFAPLSVLANIAVIPFIGILSFTGFISSIFAIIPFIDKPIVYLFDLIANPLLILLVKISEFFSSFDFSLISAVGLNIFQIFNFWVLILLFMLNLKNNFKNKIKNMILLLFVLIFLLSFVKIDNFKNDLEIMMFDVQNADCFLIKTPKNKYILIDTGNKTFGEQTSAKMIMNPYFQNKRIKNIELMLITHFDIDHAGGAIDILKNEKVKNVIIQKENDTSKVSCEILEYLKSNKINYKIALNNEIVYKENNLEFKTLTPKKEKLKPDEIDNETSIVSLLTYRGKNILFMADCTTAGFKSIEKYLPSNIEILKIGHHGAKNTIDLNMLNRVKAGYALISSGTNKYNHPHFSTVNMLDKKGIKIISTKNYGFSKIIIDKKSNLLFKHFSSKDKKMQDIIFNKNLDIPFHKTKYIQDLIEKNL